MSAAPEIVTNVKVIDFLAELDSLPLTGKERAQRFRDKKQASKPFTTCQQPQCGGGCGCLCGNPLLSKSGTLRGTDDIEKAICSQCTAVIAAYKRGCTHPNLKQFTFSDGYTIKKCPDCTRFDTGRSRALNYGEVRSRGYQVTGTGPGLVQRNPVADDLTEWTVVPIASPTLVTILPEWKEQLTERDYDRLAHEFKVYKKLKKGAYLSEELRREGFTQRVTGVGYVAWDAKCEMPEPQKEWCAECKTYHAEGRAVMMPQSKLRLVVANKNSFWPQEGDEYRPGYRMNIDGGAVPCVVAGNYNHRVEQGWFTEVEWWPRFSSKPRRPNLAPHEKYFPSPDGESNLHPWVRRYGPKY
jgi:hypothetical protein